MEKHININKLQQKHFKTIAMNTLGLRHTSYRDCYIYIQLYSPHNIVAQANKTSKNTTSEIEKMTTVPL